MRCTPLLFGMVPSVCLRYVPVIRAFRRPVKFQFTGYAFGSGCTWSFLPSSKLPIQCSLLLLLFRISVGLFERAALLSQSSEYATLERCYSKGFVCTWWLNGSLFFPSRFYIPTTLLMFYNNYCENMQRIVEILRRSQPFNQLIKLSHCFLRLVV